MTIKEMPLEEIAVDTAILRNDMTAYENALHLVNTKTDKIFEEMQMLDSMWEGTANQIFMAQFRADYYRIKEVCKVLANLLEDIESARREYDQCEASVAGVIKEIHIESL